MHMAPATLNVVDLHECCLLEIWHVLAQFRSMRGNVEHVMWCMRTFPRCAALMCGSKRASRSMHVSKPGAPAGLGDLLGMCSTPNQLKAAWLSGVTHITSLHWKQQQLSHYGMGQKPVSHCVNECPCACSCQAVLPTPLSAQARAAHVVSSDSHIQNRKGDRRAQGLSAE